MFALPVGDIVVVEASGVGDVLHRARLTDHGRSLPTARLQVFAPGPRWTAAQMLGRACLRDGLSECDA